MKRTAFLRRIPGRSLAFTLVELLVVIAIIVILMGLLLAAVPAVKEAARKAEARNTVNMVTTAVNSYYTEYARFPPTDDPNQPAAAGAAAIDDVVVGDTKMGATIPNNVLFYTLRNIPKGVNDSYGCNPRKVVFYDGRSAAVNSAGRARNGFYDKTSTGGTPPATEESCLYDPWGDQYGIVFDVNGDDRIDLKGFYADFTGVDTAGLAPRRKVGAFSMGKDEKLGKDGDKVYKNGSELSDDVVSWE